MRIKLLPEILLETKGNLVSWFALTAVSRGQINILDTRRHADNVQVLVNMASMYVTKDLARILINRRIATTTVIHHVCVFIAYGYVLRSEMKICTIQKIQQSVPYFSILTDGHAWKEEGVFKSFIAYAGFTSLDFPFEFYLWLRYFVQRDGLTDNLMKKYVLLHNVVIVSLNMVWQARYLLQLSGMEILKSHVLGYLVLFTGWIQEEYVVMEFLFKISKT